MSLQLWWLGIGGSVLYLVAVAFYRLYLDPLSKVPGPRLWAVTRLPYVRALWSGTLVRDVSSIHRQYGTIVRIAPDEVSCATGDAWQPVHGQSHGKQAFPLDPRWFSKPPNEAPSIRTAHDPNDHARIRRLLQQSFTDRTLALNEPIVQRYVDELIVTLKQRSNPGSADAKPAINMVDYFNFVTFDIIGDLCFAEPFGCLRNDNYHPWVATIYEHIRASAFLATTRFYPMLSKQLIMWIPPAILAGQKQHRQASIEKVQKRLNMEQERPDFMSPVMSKQGEKHGMTQNEIESSFHVLLTAGSETTSLVLSGILHYLLRCSDTMEFLVNEIRETFRDDGDISFVTVKKLTYLNSVIQEGLRMCPPHPSGNPRVVSEGGHMVGEYWLPGGTSIAVHQWTLFRSPSNFYNPNSFLPERWLPSAEESNSPFCNDKRFDVLAFGYGPHRCIGKDLAISEMSLIIAKLLWHFDLQLADESSPRWEDQETYFMVKRDPIWTKLRPRQV